MGIFKEVLFPHERSAWSDKDGKVKLPKNSILLPVDGDWKWETGWEIAKDPNFNDKNGWCYANDFNGPFKKTRGLLDFVRRRKWVRVASRAGAGAQDVGQISSTAAAGPQGANADQDARGHNPNFEGQAVDELYVSSLLRASAGPGDASLDGSESKKKK